jgi:hypothetical protein
MSSGEMPTPSRSSRRDTYATAEQQQNTDAVAELRQDTNTAAEIWREFNVVTYSASSSLLSCASQPDGLALLAMEIRFTIFLNHELSSACCIGMVSRFLGN